MGVTPYIEYKSHPWVQLQWIFAPCATVPEEFPLERANILSVVLGCLLGDLGVLVFANLMNGMQQWQQASRHQEQCWSRAFVTWAHVFATWFPHIVQREQVCHIGLFIDSHYYYATFSGTVMLRLRVLMNGSVCGSISCEFAKVLLPLRWVKSNQATLLYLSKILFFHSECNSDLISFLLGWRKFNIITWDPRYCPEEVYRHFLSSRPVPPFMTQWWAPG